jgi:hypothetical protein
MVCARRAVAHDAKRKSAKDPLAANLMAKNLLRTYSPVVAGKYIGSATLAKNRLTMNCWRSQQMRHLFATKPT